jgi:hypothetical protein
METVEKPVITPYGIDNKRETVRTPARDTIIYEKIISDIDQVVNDEDSKFRFMDKIVKAIRSKGYEYTKLIVVDRTFHKFPTYAQASIERELFQKLK